MYIYLLIILLILIVISNTVVFPLSAGSIESGLTAAKNISLQTNNLEHNYDLVAVIIEPRKNNLDKILQHYINTLPEYTHFQVYHGTNNITELDPFKEYINSGKISLWNLGVENLTIHSYSALLTSKEFWRSIKSENVLIFQTDSITCSNSKFQITDFIDYDLVGAPMHWYINLLIQLQFLLKGYIVGNIFYNGGLSFRKKSKMLDVLEKYPWDQLCVEELWFCAFLPKVGGKLPSVEIARQFSYESEKLTTIPWGLHKPLKNHKLLSEICPEISQIPTLNSHCNYRNLFLL